MRSVTYRLSDGTTTKSYEIAKASGMSYSVELETIREERKPISAERMAKLREFFQKKRMGV